MESSKNFSKPTRDEISALVEEHLASQYDRQPITSDPAFALEKLHDHLSSIALNYEKGPVFQRQAVADSVMAIAEFLSEQGFSSHTLTPFNRIIYALTDLCDQNRPDPLFCEKPKKTKPRRSLEEALRSGQLAALSEAWLRAYSEMPIDMATKLNNAARRMSGAHFGRLDATALSTALSYQRQTDHPEILYSAFEKMKAQLEQDAKELAAEGNGLKAAIEIQLDALNAKAILQKT